VLVVLPFSSLLLFIAAGTGKWQGDGGLYVEKPQTETSEESKNQPENGMLKVKWKGSKRENSEKKDARAVVI